MAGWEVKPASEEVTSEEVKLGSEDAVSSQPRVQGRCVGTSPTELPRPAQAQLLRASSLPSLWHRKC